MEKQLEWKVLGKLSGRVLAYAVLLGVVSVLMMQGARWPYALSFYGENGLVEWSQVFFLTVSIFLFWRACTWNRGYRPVMTVIMLLLVSAAVRELDSLLDVYLGRHWWKLIVVSLAAVAGWIALRRREEFFRSVVCLTRQPSFGILLSGALMVLIFSRLLGYGDFWRELLDDRAMASIVKEIAEECTELIGYFFILIGAFECLHETKSERTSTEESSRQTRPHE